MQEENKQETMQEPTAANNQIQKTYSKANADSNNSKPASSHKKKKKDSQIGQLIRFTLILVLIVGVIIAVYLRITNNSKNSAKRAEENMTEVEILKLYDMDNKYPKTAREVVKMHCRLLKCAYNEKLSDSDYEILNDQIRSLFAQQLLSQNDINIQLDELKNTTKEFRTDGRIYVSYTVEQEDGVQYSTVDGVEYALVMMTCNIKQSAGTSSLSEEYLLCKEDGKWKIVGWQGVASEHAIEGY